MTPAEPAHLEHATPADDAVPDYVLDLERAADYLTAEQRALLRLAWAVRAAAHAGQLRKSGEPSITLPVAVARVLAEQNVDVETLVAAILHDTVEDTPRDRAQIARLEEHTSELQSLMRNSDAVFCLKNNNTTHKTQTNPP